MTGVVLNGSWAKNVKEDVVVELRLLLGVIKVIVNGLLWEELKV